MAKIIVALDYTNPLDALEMAARLRDVVDGFKINHALWSQSVYIKDYTKDNELFIDCKLWDTPNTVKQVLQKIVDKGATMTTICTHNNTAVFEAVQPFAEQIKLLGVTYLTSWHGQERAELFKDTVQVMWVTDEGATTYENFFVFVKKECPEAIPHLVLNYGYPEDFDEQNNIIKP